MEEKILGKRYKILQRIGLGGMAYVYEAEDMLLKRKVAIKILKQEFVEDQDFVRKFEIEAQAAAGLSHSNIVNIYDVGDEMINDKHLYYIVMELIEGTTLKEVIQNSKSLSQETMVRLGVQIAQALQRAHNQGIVHRDIKPANILITKEGQVKVADFGIARMSTSATITYTSSILGTVHYISPEQAKGKYIDLKSDIYSLGVVLYEMATGKVPFDAENSVGIAIQHIQEDPVPPMELNSRLSQGFNDIILRCLEKKPEDRFHSCMELIEALNNVDRYTDTKTMTLPNKSLGRIRESSHKVKEVKYENKMENASDEREGSSGGFLWKAGLAGLGLLVAFVVIYFLSNYNNRQFEEEMTKVPSVIELTESEAIKLLTERNLQGEVVSRDYDENVASGLVLDQSIKSGLSVKKDTVVKLVISLGKEELPFPDLTGLTLEEAKKMLTDQGFVSISTNYEYSNEMKEGLVIRTEPQAELMVNPSDHIVLVVSNGVQITRVEVPEFTGKSQADAIAKMMEANLSVGSISQENSDYPIGTVIRQSIAPGEMVEKQTTIDLVVSSGPEQIDHSEDSMVKYNLRLVPPLGKDSFEVTVFDEASDSKEPLYQMTLDQSKVNENGFIEISIEAGKNAKFAVYYDGVLASTQTESKEE